MNTTEARNVSPTSATSGLRRRRRFRVIIPAFPAFNIYSRVARITTALGPLYIATIVNKMDGWDAEVVDENNYRHYGPVTEHGLPDHAALQRIRPADVVGFYGGLSSTAPRVYELANFYQSQGVTTMAGGQHFIGAENIAEALENGVQYIVIGEGEITIHELLRTLEAGREPTDVVGVAFLSAGRIVQTPPREPLTDFDLLPVPDFSLIRYAKIRLFPVSWVRGCGMNCEFCTVKGRPRCPAPSYVLEQIMSLVERHNARHFFIVDDLFGQNRSATLELCALLADYQETIKTRLDLTVQIRLDKAKDRELLAAMRRAGVNTVAIGFESPITEELAAMNKRIKPEEMIALSRIYHEAGFLVHGMFIFGYPIPGGAPVNLTVEARVRRFRKFIRAARIDTVQLLLPVPLPGTEMTARLAAQGRIYPRTEIGWEYYDGNFPVFEPDPPLSAEDMQTAARKIMGRFYHIRHLFLIGLNILLFPSLVFSLHNLRRGWHQWYRSWRNDLVRFGGWLILRKWISAFKKGSFNEKLMRARTTLRNSRPSVPA